jgi:hypothetical protein
MKAGKNLLSFIFGIALIIVGILLMSEFLFKFLKFTLGIILFFIGLALAFRRYY